MLPLCNYLPEIWDKVAVSCCSRSRPARSSRTRPSLQSHPLGSCALARLRERTRTMHAVPRALHSPVVSHCSLALLRRFSLACTAEDGGWNPYHIRARLCRASSLSCRRSYQRSSMQGFYVRSIVCSFLRRRVLYSCLRKSMLWLYSFLVQTVVYRFFGFEYKPPNRAPVACPYKPKAKKVRKTGFLGSIDRCAACGSCHCWCLHSLPK